MEKITAAELARRRGVSRQAASKAIRRHGIPLDADGRLDPRVASALWPYSPRSAVVSREAPAGESVASSATEHALLARARRERVEMENRALAGELIDKQQAVESSRRAGMTIRDAMLSIPGKVAADLVGLDEREIERRMTLAIRDELTRLAQTVATDA